MEHVLYPDPPSFLDRAPLTACWTPLDPARCSASLFTATSAGRLIRALKLPLEATSLGGVESLVSAPSLWRPGPRRFAQLLLGLWLFTVELEHHRDALRKVFEDEEIPSVAEVTRLAHERNQAQRDVAGTQPRIELVNERRDNVRLFRFRERQELDARLADAREGHLKQLERSQRADRTHGLAEHRLYDWLERHGDQAARLLATHHELNDRQQHNVVAVARQEAVERTPDWADRELPAPEIVPDLGRDLGW